MELAKRILKSRQTWTIVALFVYNGISGIQEVLPPWMLPAVNPILSALAIYFRIKPKQKF